MHFTLRSSPVQPDRLFWPRFLLSLVWNRPLTVSGCWLWKTLHTHGHRCTAGHWHRDQWTITQSTQANKNHITLDPLAWKWCGLNHCLLPPSTDVKLGGMTRSHFLSLLQRSEGPAILVSKVPPRYDIVAGVTFSPFLKILFIELYCPFSQTQFLTGLNVLLKHSHHTDKLKPQMKGSLLKWSLLEINDC